MAQANTQALTMANLLVASRLPSDGDFRRNALIGAMISQVNPLAGVVVAIRSADALTTLVNERNALAEKAGAAPSAPSADASPKPPSTGAAPPDSLKGAAAPAQAGSGDPFGNLAAALAQLATDAHVALVKALEQQTPAAPSPTGTGGIGAPSPAQAAPQTKDGPTP